MASGRGLARTGAFSTRSAVVRKVAPITVLQQHETEDELLDLKFNCIGYRHHSWHPTNIQLCNTIEFVTRRLWDGGITRFFSAGVPSDGGYAFIVDDHPMTIPYLAVRSPVGEGDPSLIREAVPEVISAMRERIDDHGCLYMECDETVREAFMEQLHAGGHGEFDVEYTGEFARFYLDNDQMAALMEKPTPLPDGFRFSAIDADTEFQTIHDHWAYGDCENALVTRDRLHCLPSIGIRNAEGKLVTWEMSHNCGTLSNLYTLPEYRSLGLASTTITKIMQKYVKLGLRISNMPSHGNAGGISACEKNPLLTRWMKEDGKPMVWTLILFRKKK